MAACGGRCALGHLPPQGWTLRMLFLSRGEVISINYYVTKILFMVNISSNILFAIISDFRADSERTTDSSESPDSRPAFRRQSSEPAGQPPTSNGGHPSNIPTGRVEGLFLLLDVGTSLQPASYLTPSLTH